MVFNGLSIISLTVCPFGAVALNKHYCAPLPAYLKPMDGRFFEMVASCSRHLTDRLRHLDRQRRGVRDVKAGDAEREPHGRPEGAEVGAALRAGTRASDASDASDV